MNWDQYQQKKKPGVLKGNFNSSHLAMFPQSSKFRTSVQVLHREHYGRCHNVFARRQRVIFLESEQMRMNSGTSAIQTLACRWCSTTSIVNSSHINFGQYRWGPTVAPGRCDLPLSRDASRWDNGRGGAKPTDERHGNKNGSISLGSR